jgi:Uma2 family endonuclease
MVVRATSEMIALPLDVRFPVEVRAPSEFRAEEAATWPAVHGRLEYVKGRLLFMPPCGDIQQDVAGSVAGILDRWLDEHGDFVFGTNEAGMLLGGDVRGADAAVWRRTDAVPRTGGFRRMPPILAIEIVGRDEDECDLREKASWYLSHGVRAVWIVLPATREVLVVRAGGELRVREGQRLPAHPDLPGLEPEVAQLFKRL